MIRIKELHRTYKTGDSEVQALKGIDLEIEQGEFLAIAGPSGSGKTTLLNIIGCIDSADSGTVLIDDIDITKTPHRKLASFRRENLGFVFQSFNLIPVLSAFENTALPLQLLKKSEKEILQQVMSFLSDVGLSGMENRRPNKLSGGQQQRVAIARALVKYPKILLLDEPTANLDSKTGNEILELMKRMNKKYQSTFIFSTHDPSVMERASRLILLHDGKIHKDERR